ncbi:MAG: hypothetical protein OXF42_06925 [Candidatus Dadabacteria bacterium]|nr:hypothetical protein [Candidatus Dadabacteria bacterium]
MSVSVPPINPESETAALEALAGWLAGARRAVFLTGPELTAEAGIPDAGALSFNPDINEFKEDEQAREAYWEKLAAVYPKIAAAAPAAAHKAIYGISLVCGVDCVITQAVDGLHTKAGSPAVLEIYASVHWAQCLGCGKDFRMMDILTGMAAGGVKIPSCAVCRAGVLKPPLSFPGQPLPHWEIREGWIKVGGCDLLVCAGASLENEPVRSFPMQAKQRGARVAMISAHESEADTVADAVLQGSPSVILDALLAEIKKSKIV